MRDVAGRSPLHRLSFQIREAAKSIIGASATILKKKTIARRVASRRKLGQDRGLGGRKAALKEVAKQKKSQ